jgi:plastocyanin
VNFKHKFSKSGTYKIICTIHPEMTMKVKVN